MKDKELEEHFDKVLSALEQGIEHFSELYRNKFLDSFTEYLQAVTLSSGVSASAFEKRLIDSYFPKVMQLNRRIVAMALEEAESANNIVITKSPLISGLSNKVH